MRVTGDRVNLRAGPGVTFEQVGQVSRGDRVEARGATNGWVKITPPDHAAAWVYAELIATNRVIASRVSVRSGPGISYRPVGSLERGSEISVLESRGDWLKIKPPRETHIWISEDYVEKVRDRTGDRAVAAVRAAPAVPAVPSPRATPPRPKAAPPTVADTAPSRPPTRPSGVSKAVQPVQAAVPDKPSPRQRQRSAPRHETPATRPELPAALEGRTLDASLPQGEVVEYDGRIARAAWTFGRLSRFRLVQKDRYGRWLTVCYVLGNEGQLEGILERDVRLRGRAYRVTRVRYPAVLPDQIVLRPVEAGTD